LILVCGHNIVESGWLYELLIVFYEHLFIFPFVQQQTAVKEKTKLSQKRNKPSATFGSTRTIVICANCFYFSLFGTRLKAKRAPLSSERGRVRQSCLHGRDRGKGTVAFPVLKIQIQQTMNATKTSCKRFKTLTLFKSIPDRKAVDDCACSSLTFSVKIQGCLQ